MSQFHALSYPSPKAAGTIRFQDLSEDIQDRITRAFEEGRPPSVDYPGLTPEILSQWYVDMNVFEFWVRHRNLRNP